MVHQKRVSFLLLEMAWRVYFFPFCITGKILRLIMYPICRFYDMKHKTTVDGGSQSKTHSLIKIPSIFGINFTSIAKRIVAFPASETKYYHTVFRQN